MYKRYFQYNVVVEMCMNVYVCMYVCMHVFVYDGNKICVVLGDARHPSRLLDCYIYIYINEMK